MPNRSGMPGRRAGVRGVRQRHHRLQRAGPRLLGGLLPWRIPDELGQGGAEEASAAPEAGQQGQADPDTGEGELSDLLEEHHESRTRQLLDPATKQAWYY